MKSGILYALAMAILWSSDALAQGMAINASGGSADASAMLDVASTSKGMLAPRMTAAQRTAISSPATGLLVYQTDATTGFYVYNGSAWVAVSSGSGSAGGDLTGSYPNPTLAATSTAGGHVVSAINAGSSVVNPANLGTGTASSATYLRGDGTWATPSIPTPKFVIPISSVTPFNLTTTSTGAKDSVTMVGLGYGINQWININAGSYLDNSGTPASQPVPVPVGGTITSFSAFHSLSPATSTFLAIFGNYTLTMSLYYSAPPSGSVIGTAQFFPVPGASVSINLTTACSICIYGESINGSVSGLSFPISANSRLLVLCTLSSSTTPSSPPGTFSGYLSASVGLQ